MTLEKLALQLKNQNVLVFGLGVQGGGVGDANFADKLGANVRVSDLKTEDELKDSLAQLNEGIGLSLGGHDIKDIGWADIIIRNPGVPWEHKHIQHALSIGKTVWVSAAVFIANSPIPVIGITGTRGKSTTTNLIYQILNDAYPGQVILGGNIPGVSTMSLLENADTKKYAVLELSSWQLQGLAHQKVSPHYALITNLYEDHLNRYDSMEDYIKDKLSITAHQSANDFLFFNKDNELLSSQVIDSAAQIISYSKAELPKISVDSLPGEHNRENIAAAYALCKHLGLSETQIIQSIQRFKALPFRLERVGEYEGRLFINDTTSTTPTSTIKAVRAINKPQILILGGASKNLDISSLIDELCTNDKVKKIVILGSEKLPELLSELMRCKDKIARQVFSMKDAVRAAYQESKPGDAILLSPGFASFDLFENEFDRGRQFNKYFKELADA